MFWEVVVMEVRGTPVNGEWVLPEPAGVGAVNPWLVQDAAWLEHLVLSELASTQHHADGWEFQGAVLEDALVVAAHVPGTSLLSAGSASDVQDRSMTRSWTSMLALQRTEELVGRLTWGGDNRWWVTVIEPVRATDWSWVSHTLGQPVRGVGWCGHCGQPGVANCAWCGTGRCAPELDTGWPCHRCGAIT